MPIRQYTSTAAAEGLRIPNANAPAEKATIAGATGQRLGAFQEQAGRARAQGLENLATAATQVGVEQLSDVDKYLAHEEISTGALARDKEHNRLLLDWQDRLHNSDLNDHTTGDEFLQKPVEDTIQQWQEGFHTEAGKQWAEGQAASWRNELYSTVRGDMASRAGDAAVLNLRENLNQKASMANANPAAFQNRINDLKGDIETMVATSNLTGPQADRLRTDFFMDGAEHIAAAAAHGAILRNPEAALKDLTETDKYDAYLGDKSEFIRSARSMIAARDEQARAAVRFKNEQDKQAFGQATTKIILGMIQAEGRGNVVQQTPAAFDALIQAAQMPGAEPTAVRTMMDFIKTAHEEGPAFSDGGVIKEVQTRMLLPIDDPNHLTTADIVDAANKGYLSKADVARYTELSTKLASDPVRVAAYKQFNSVMDSVKATFRADPLLGNLFSADGAQRYGLFLTEKQNEFERSFVAGDWQKRVVPGKDFLNNDIDKYLLPSKDAVGAYIQQLQGGSRLAAPAQGASGANPYADIYKPGMTVEQVDAEIAKRKKAAPVVVAPPAAEEPKVIPDWAQQGMEEPPQGDMRKALGLKQQ